MPSRDLTDVTLVSEDHDGPAEAFVERALFIFANDAYFIVYFC